MARQVDRGEDSCRRQGNIGSITPTSWMNSTGKATSIGLQPAIPAERSGPTRIRACRCKISGSTSRMHTIRTSRSLDTRWRRTSISSSVSCRPHQIRAILSWMHLPDQGRRWLRQRISAGDGSAWTTPHSRASSLSSGYSNAASTKVSSIVPKRCWISSTTALARTHSWFFRLKIGKSQRRRRRLAAGKLYRKRSRCRSTIWRVQPNPLVLFCSALWMVLGAFRWTPVLWCIRRRMLSYLCRSLRVLFKDEVQQRYLFLRLTEPIDSSELLDSRYRPSIQSGVTLSSSNFTVATTTFGSHRRSSSE